MPKRVDHEERRQHIAEAVLSLTAQHGLEAVSLRDVAAEANVSMGRVQHYFKTKQEMILFACQYMVELAEHTAQEAVSKSESPSAKAFLRELCLQPLKPKHHAGTRVWLAFMNKALTEPELATFFRSTWAGTHSAITEQLRSAQKAGQLSKDLDVAREASVLLTLIEGLMPQVLTGYCSYQEAVKTLNYYLEPLFG